MVSQSNVYLGMMDPIAYCFRNTTAVTTSGFLKWVAIHEIMNRQVRRWSIPLAGSAKTRTIFWQNHRFYEYNIYIYSYVCVVLILWFYMHGFTWIYWNYISFYMVYHDLSMGLYVDLEMFEPEVALNSHDSHVSNSWLRRSGRASPEIPGVPIHRCGERTASVGG